jgi:hypothetical protein
VEKKLRVLNIPLFSSQVTKYATPQGKALLKKHNEDLKTQLCDIEEQIRAKDEERSLWNEEREKVLLAKGKPEDEKRKKIEEYYKKLDGEIEKLKNEAQTISQNRNCIRERFGFFEDDHKDDSKQEFSQIKTDVEQIFVDLGDINISNSDGWARITGKCELLAKNLQYISNMKKEVQKTLRKIRAGNEKLEKVTGLSKCDILYLAKHIENIHLTIADLILSLSTLNTKLEHSLNIALSAQDKDLKISTTDAIKKHKEFLSQMVDVFKVLPIIFKHRVEISKSILGNMGDSSQSGQDHDEFLTLSSV